jgi:hypothetical protein
LAEPLYPDPATAAGQVITALKAGRVLSAITALTQPAALTFTAVDEQGTTASQGDIVGPSDRPITFVAQSNAPDSSVTVLRKDGRILTQTPRRELRVEAPREAGTYRIEVYLPDAPGNPPIPWIVSNPIYVRPEGWGSAPTPRAPAMTDRHVIQGGPWHVEKDAESSATFSHIKPPDGPVEFTYRLAGGDRRTQYAALAISVGTGLAERKGLSFRAAASRAMRISVQARRPKTGERWQRSVYLDAVSRDVFVPLAEMTPMAGSTSAFDPALADTVLFVVDLTNALPGATGVVTLSDVRIER